MHRPKKILTSKVVHKNPWYQVRQDDFLRPDGKQGKYYSIVSDPFVIICALSSDARKVCMVKNWRYPVRRYLLEFPMGWREPNETPLMAAKRELTEETGLVAKKWTAMGAFYLAPGISTQQGHVFLAERTTVGDRAKSSDEVVKSQFVSLNILRTRLAKGLIPDAPTAMALSRLLYRLG
jgi:8-oxo-dGTP pyrophosphatase MutT (NUDIX family)